ncbi:adenosylcobinamide-phosphate synthase CbiB [Cochlodiniinecator piscidefendens]|uniref:adenosylcobinamide-phosphate synthase CbiB n=1 Tax=Cochlodiniinecator piscidefendens TaxID=2715756 RepID=UPI001408968C|nr:adenosylcobinamide-phosphate synthase CbiB [Cochlodiniinecator piscidefendens]
MTAFILPIAMLLDAALGEPKWLWDRIPHPAVLMGRIIGGADTKFNSGLHRKFKGILVCASLVLCAAFLGILIESLPFGSVLSVLITAILIAQKSLTQHVQAVSTALRGSIEDARYAVSMIVGRDTSNMDGPAVARSAIESAAENMSDGVVAPIFWFLIAGLPGLLVYKIVNTADSMIGYKNERYGDFGWASARFDDVLNWAPARLTAILIALTSLRTDAFAVITRDAKLHRSPNAGWPEAAIAVVLGISLSGPRSYDGEMRDFPFVHPEGTPNANADDIDASLSVLWRVWTALLIFALILTAF